MCWHNHMTNTSKKEKSKRMKISKDWQWYKTITGQTDDKSGNSYKNFRLSINVDIFISSPLPTFLRQAWSTFRRGCRRAWGWYRDPCWSPSWCRTCRTPSVRRPGYTHCTPVQKVLKSIILLNNFGYPICEVCVLPVVVLTKNHFKIYTIYWKKKGYQNSN